MRSKVKGDYPTPGRCESQNRPGSPGRADAIPTICPQGSHLPQIRFAQTFVRGREPHPSLLAPKIGDCLLEQRDGVIVRSRNAIDGRMTPGGDHRIPARSVFFKVLERGRQVIECTFGVAERVEELAQVFTKACARPRLFQNLAERPAELGHGID